MSTSMTHGYHELGETRLGAVWRIVVSWRSLMLWACTAMCVGLGCRRDGAQPPPESDAPNGEAEGSVEEAAVDRAPASAEPTAEPEAAPPTAAMAGSCPSKDAAHVGVLVTPKNPAVGDAVTVVAATLEGEAPLAVRLEDADATDVTHRSGVPAATIVRFTAAKAGKAKLVVGRDGEGLACATIAVSKSSSRRQRAATDDGVWPVSRAWSGAEEALFSAWVREMFHAPRGDDLAWKALHHVTSDKTRNVLHSHYGWGEDDPDTKVGLYLRPDCADTPYFLRAYYAWKRELPHGFRQCSRGKGSAPKCGRLQGVLGKPDAPPDAKKGGELGAVQKYFGRTVAWGVHSGNGRTAFGADASDFYPLELSRRSLRPGAIYADPYGHLFVIVELMSPQGKTPGILYAIDGQPDGSITRKRFWEGNFLFNPDPSLGGSGFKGHRPVEIVKGAEGKQLVALGDAAIEKRAGYGDVSDEQAKLEPDAFYDRMDALITPGKRDPFIAMEEAVQALFEAAKVRVTSVQNGLDEVSGTVPMPTGHAVFETTGGWENYSTPARDLRLLIAIDLVKGFDDKVARNADIFLREGQSMDELRRELVAHREKLLKDPDLSFEYERSDGSKHRLTVADVIDRAKAFEVAYNPNDCPEHRWGAPEGSAERKTCKRRAPADQQRKMQVYRKWFAERRRPARGDPGPPVSP
jgi:hypothetical protein